MKTVDEILYNDLMNGTSTMVIEKKVSSVAIIKLLKTSKDNLLKVILGCLAEEIDINDFKDEEVEKVFYYDGKNVAIRQTRQNIEELFK